MSKKASYFVAISSPDSQFKKSDGYPRGNQDIAWEKDMFCSLKGNNNLIDTYIFIQYTVYILKIIFLPKKKVAWLFFQHAQHDLRLNRDSFVAFKLLQAPEAQLTSADERQHKALLSNLLEAFF